MTEDCIEISYHLEYCQRCQEGGIEGTLDLLSLMGCNLYDLHFTHEADGFANPAVSELKKDTLTAEGKRNGRTSSEQRSRASGTETDASSAS